MFSTSDGAPIAFLLVAESDGAERDCMFFVAARDARTFDSAEAQVILPGRPAEYRCSVATGPLDATIRFTNRDGWLFVAVVRADGTGAWTATKDGRCLAGNAAAVP